MLLLFTLVISSIFLLRPFTVKADVNVNINKETQIVTDLIGQYSINYTGDANFFGFYGYYENNNYNEMVKDTDFKATVDTIGKDKIVNSSIASLKKTDGATQIEAAYLVWETSVQGKNNTDLVKKAANKAVYFAGSTDKGAFTKKVNASYAAVDMREPHLGTKEYTFSCMYVDVTSVVQKYGYGKYGVANIPYAASMKTSNTDKGTHAGESSSAWQLIVIEKNSKANVRAVSLKIGSHFNYQWEGSTWTKNPVSMNLNLGDCKTNQYINEDSEVSGELLLLGTNSGIVKSNATEQKSFGLELYDRVNKDKNKNDKLAYSNSGLIGHSYFYHGDTQLSSKLSSVRGILTDFSMNKDDGAHPGFATNKFRAEASDSSWSTLFVVGLAVDVADYDLISNQDTTVTSAVSATVTGGIQVKTDQPDTGYYDGKLVVTLDDALTPIKGETIFTVLDKGVKNPKEKKLVYGTAKELKYDAAKHTLTLSGYDNKADGSYVGYTISCSVKENSGKKVFKNQYEVVGKLRSQSFSTGIEKKTEPLSSQAVPMYRFTVKMDKTAGKNIDIQRFNPSGRYYTSLTVLADQKLLAGDYYVGSVDIPYNGIISAVRQENKKKILFEYLLALDLKVKRGEYADFIRGITPLIIDLLEMVLEQFCKINVTQYYKKKERKWDRYKLDGTEVLGIMNEKFYPFRYGIVYSSHLQPIIEKKCKDDLLKQRTKGLVEIEQNVRNIAAHNIVSATPEWVKEQAGRSVEDILWLLKYICEQVKINTRKENWDSYDYMNKRIIEELDR